MNYFLIIGLFLVIHVVSSNGQTYYYSQSYNGQNFDQANCQIKSYGLKTIKDVQNAIDNAREGDIIRLDPIDYEGDLQLKIKNNKKYISIVGDNQCNHNTVIRGRVSIDGHNYILNAIVFEKSDKAIDVINSKNIRLMNLVINEINGNAIEVSESQSVQVDNLVVDNVGKNALDFKATKDIRVRNAVISNVGGVALNFDHCVEIELANNVFRNIVHEVIKITDVNTSNVRIAQTVINGDSPKGQGWMWLEGNNYRISNTVATGAPRNGIVVNGCNFGFQGNICTMGGYGFCIYQNNKQNNCQISVGITNLNIGGRGLYNRY